jgi:hypothetical protein
MIPPLQIHTDGRVSAAAVFWRAQGRTRVTIVARATFSLRADGPAEILAPRPIEREDRQFGDHPARSVEAANDLAPWRARCDVTFLGNAYAPGGQPATATSVRLALYRDGRALIDKTLHVYGDRVGETIKPFVTMPLVYERAQGGLGSAANPVGVEAPNVVDPSDPSRPAGFGPIARAWPARKRLLKDVNREALSGPLLLVPEGFPWDYYQAAPLDQRVDPLAGGEWIVLDGLSASEARLRTQVPPAGAQAVIAPAGSAARKPITLVADTLAIDGERRSFSIAWRGHHVIADGEMESPLLVGAALGAPGREVDWSAIFAGPASVSAAPAPSRKPDAEGTVAVSEEAARRAIAPFPVAGAGSGTTGNTAATPWASAPPASVRAPVPGGGAEGTINVDPEGTIAAFGGGRGPALPFSPGAAPAMMPASPAARRPEVGGETIAAIGPARDAEPSWLEVTRAPLTIGQRYASTPSVAAPAEITARSEEIAAPAADPPPSREEVAAVLRRCGATEEDIEAMFAEADRRAREA